MASVPTFDTHKAAKRLQDEGNLPEEASGAIVNVVTDATSPLVTEATLEKALLKERLWMIGSMAALTGIALAAVEILN